MICKKCGEIVNDSARVCPVCGAKLSKGGALNPVYQESGDCAHDEHPRKKRSTGNTEDLKGLLILVFALAAVVGLPVLASLAFRTGAYGLLFGVVIIVAVFVIIARNNRK